VRLACLNHAASVQAEPGSNSSIKFLGTASASCPASLVSKLTRTNSFASCVYPRNEFIQLTRSCYRSVARLKHLHWLWTDRVRIRPLKLQGMIRRSSIACTTKMSELDRFLRPVPFSPAQPRANKPSVRRLTSSRRFDYLVVKEQHSEERFYVAAFRTRYWPQKFLSYQRKERNDNAEKKLVKRVFADSREPAKLRHNRVRSAGRLSVGTNSLHERQTSARVAANFQIEIRSVAICHFAVKSTAEYRRI
jgi:hypothetical protein